MSKGSILGIILFLIHILIYIYIYIYIYTHTHTHIHLTINIPGADTYVCQWHKYSKKCWKWKYSKSKNKQNYECIRKILVPCKWFSDKQWEIYSNVFWYLAEYNFLRPKIWFANTDIKYKYETKFLGLHVTVNLK